MKISKKHFLASAFGLGVALSVQAESRDVYYAAHDNTRQHAIHFVSPAPKAALLFVHGLQSHSEWMRGSGAGEALARRGISVLAFDRRGSGQSSTERGYASSGAELLKDLNDAVVVFRKELRKQGLELGRDIELHLMANCFGVRIAVPYVVEAEAKGKNPFASMIFIAPSTHMRKSAEYNILEKLKVLVQSGHSVIETPLKDEWFVSSGPGLEWIRSDRMGLREVSVDLLKAVNGLTKVANREIYSMKTPMMIMTAKRDVMVDSDKVVRELYAPYEGVKRHRSFDSEHSLEFGPARDAFVAETVDWLTGSGLRARKSAN